MALDTRPGRKSDVWRPRHTTLYPLEDFGDAAEAINTLTLHAAVASDRTASSEGRTVHGWVVSVTFSNTFWCIAKCFYMPRLIGRCIKHWPPSVCPSVNLIFCFVHTVSSNAEARYWYIDVGIHSVRPSMYLPLCVRVWVYVPLPL